jgi:tripartite-type tricarboxylate transporter receptor subunit TctC
MIRNKTIFTVLTILAVFGMFSSAVAEEYPTKPVQMLIPFGAGGSADSMGRLIAKASEKYLGQNIVAVNKPGAGGGIMLTALHDAKPDGYMIGWGSTGILTATNIGNVPFKHDVFTHVARIGYSAMPIAVRADAPWNTFEEFAAYAKENPNKIKIGNAGTGSATHLTPIFIEKELGLQFIHVPLGAQRRVPSLLGGEVEAICVPLPEVAGQVQAGKAKILVIPSAERDPSFPDVPTMKDLGYDVVIELFRGISVPKGTPDAVVAKLEEAFRKGSEDPEFIEFSKKNGFNIAFMGKAEFNEYVEPMDAKIAMVMQETGLSKK